MNTYDFEVTVEVSWEYTPSTDPQTWDSGEYTESCSVSVKAACIEDAHDEALRWGLMFAKVEASHAHHFQYQPRAVYRPSAEKRPPLP